MVRAISRTGGGVTTQQQIEASGWTIEVMQHNADCSQFLDYRAVLGGFCTPWRGTKEAVLQDVRNYQIKPNLEPKTL